MAPQSAYEADPIFDATSLQLEYLLGRIHAGSLAIPDFQRDFTWEPRRTASLLRSIMSRYPAGNFLFWGLSVDNSGFGWRSVEGAPEATVKPADLVLDGQQRLTSLYRALNNVGDERFYLDMTQLIEFPDGDSVGRVLEPGQVDFDAALFWYPKHSKDAKQLDTRSQRISRDVLAIDEYRQFDDWLDDYFETRAVPGDAKELRRRFREVKDAYLLPLRGYGFPVVTLPGGTSIEAVATVFETINSTGKPLGPFELLTARFYPSNVRLRDLWDKALQEHNILDEFNVDAYSVLQAVTLRMHGSAQRSDVLRKLTASDIEQSWSAVVKGYARALEFLQRECGVVSPKFLPYAMMVVPLAAVWDDISATKGPELAAINGRVKRFFWCSVFGTNYDQGANSQAGADYLLLKEWLFDSSARAPEAVRGLDLLDSTLATATTRRKALYLGLLCLTVVSGARDFHSGNTLDAQRVRSDKIDSHHIFPRDYLRSLDQSGLPSSELALNRTLIDPSTNKLIGAKAPSVYVNDLLEKQPEGETADILRSHFIDASDEEDPLLGDDYEGFLSQRLADFIAAIELETGLRVLREIDQGD